MKENIAELVLRMQAGDRSAWESLYQATVKEAYFVARKIVHKEQDAEDIVQDAYLVAFEKLSQLQEPEKFASWLNMIVANRCRDYLKKKKPALFSEISEEGGAEPDWADDREYSLPEQSLDHKETVRLVAEMIEELAEDQKLCVILYYREEMSVVQIAEALGVSEGTVKSRLNYARQKVKAKVEALEKKGVKLYGMAPMPLLALLLREEAKATELPAGLSAVGAAATTGTAAGTASAAAKATAAGVAIKSAGTALVTKIVAACAAVAVAVGGAVYFTQQDKEPTMSTQTDEQQGSVVVDTAIIEQAYTAYGNFLLLHTTPEGYSTDYYAYVDLNKDNVPELLVANSQPSYDFMTDGGLYVYKDGAVEFCTYTGSYYTPVYLVNDSCLRTEHRLGAYYHDLEGWFSVLSGWDMNAQKETYERTDSAGNKVQISEEEFMQYWAMPGEVEGAFAKTAEEIIYEPNPYHEEITLETNCFTLTLPADWDGLYEAEISNYIDACYINVYEKQSREEIDAGLLFSIRTYPVDEDVSYFPNYDDLGVAEYEGTPLRVIALYPTDLQFTPVTQEAYTALYEQVPEVVASVVLK